MVGWLYEGADRRLPSGVRRLIETGEPFVPAIVELELTYLYEVGRVTEPATAPLDALRKRIGLQVADASTAALAKTAAELSWTRDPFDRMIAAQAILADSPLLTADRTILEHLPLATWE
ncbi:MAG: type II toxin-antitoxin system VapC family toxin [Solirubrobacterales bacterium]